MPPIYFIEPRSALYSSPNQ